MSNVRIIAEAGNNMPAVKLDLTTDEVSIDAGVWRKAVGTYSPLRSSSLIDPS